MADRRYQFRANFAGRYIEMRMRRVHLSMHTEGILVPRAYDPSGLRQESRALGATILKEQRK